MKNADESDFDSFIKSPLHRWKALHPYYLVNAQWKRYPRLSSIGTGNRQRYQSKSFNRETLWHLDSKYSATCQKRSYFYHLSDRWCGDFSQRRKSKKLSMGWKKREARYLRGRKKWNWKPSSGWLFSPWNRKYTHLGGIILFHVCTWNFSTLSAACTINANAGVTLVAWTILLRWEAEGARAAQDFGNPHAGFYFMLWKLDDPSMFHVKTEREKWTYSSMQKNEKRIDEYARRILNAFRAACRYPPDHKLYIANVDGTFAFYTDLK